MTKALAKTERKSPAPNGMNEEQKELIKNTVAKGATDDELHLFLYTANRLGLDPLTRQIHFVKRRQWDNDSRQYKEVGTIQTGIDGYRVAAARTGEHAGTDDAMFVDDANNLPRSATVTVYRLKAGQRYAFTATARWSEYAQTKFDKDTKTETLMGLWRKMPYSMLAKCAEALALRKGFPEVLAGTYTNEEMTQEDGEPTHTESGNPKGTITQPQSSKIHALIGENKWSTEIVNGWTQKVYGARISGLSVEQAAEAIDALEKKAAKEKAAKEPPKPEPIEADFTEPEPFAGTPAYEQPATKTDWMAEARNCQDAETAAVIIETMKSAGESDMRVGAVRGILNSKNFNV